MKEKEENSYRNILKGTSLFGGVQLFQILINLIRGKFVAMFLGPGGMGISALFASSANTLQQFCSLGLNLAIVKEISSNKDNPDGLAAIVKTSRRLITATSVVGLTACILFSPLLSQWAFGDKTYAWQFALLSLMIFFAISGSGELSILQGLHDVKRLSKASLVGAVTGLFVGVPLYYFFGDKGIVPAMIALSLSSLIFYRVSVHKTLDIKDRHVPTWKESRPLIKRLLSLGFILMASNLIGTLCGYLINTFVRSTGSLDDVGFFQASNSLTNQCVGVVFTAMSLDYFPRLSAISSDNGKMKDVVNKQTEIVSLLIAPILTALITLAPLVVDLLLTESFRSIVPLLRWMAVGTLLKTLSFPMGYIAFAKDNKRLFFWLEGVTGNILWLLLSCLFYHWFGLIGIGIGMVVDFGICLLLYFIVNNTLYQYNFDRRSLLLSVYAAIPVVATFVISTFVQGTAFYFMSGAILLLTALFSIRQLVRIWKLRQHS